MPGPKRVHLEVQIAERVLESLAVRHFLLPFEEQEQSA